MPPNTIENNGIFGSRERFGKLPLDQWGLSAYRQEKLYQTLDGMIILEYIENYFILLERDLNGEILPYDQMSQKGKRLYDTLKNQMRKAYKCFRREKYPECCIERLHRMCFDVLLTNKDFININFGKHFARKLIKKGHVQYVFENKEKFGLTVLEICELCIDEKVYSHIMDNIDNVENNKRGHIIMRVIQLGGTEDVIEYFEKKGCINVKRKKGMGGPDEIISFMCFFCDSISKTLRRLDGLNKNNSDTHE